MAMDTRRKRRRQESLWIPVAELPSTAAHPFYQQLNAILDDVGFDAFVEETCQAFYAPTMGRPSLAPGIYFRLLLIGYFEGLDSERTMVGGFSSLRGFRAGSFVGDNIAAGSIELRVPLNSPMGFGQAGLKIFGDAASAYEHGTTLEHATFHYGWGGGWYLRAPLVLLDLDVAYGVDSGARLHAQFGLKF